MKTKFYLIQLFCFVTLSVTNAQNPGRNTATNNNTVSDYWNSYANRLHLSASEKAEFLTSHQQVHQQQADISNLKPAGPSPQNILAAPPCVNIDFESGGFNGWTRSCGYHPIFNPIACCGNPNGQQTIMTGAGLDPAGNFPVVAPGGNFSLRLGNNVTGGEADRIEQTFLVSASNANFTYRYAVVFQDPGHVVAQQPSFQVEMLDSNGTNVPCTFYNVAAANNIPGFLNSPNMNGVVYKPWTNVMVDLSNYIGQNITIRFTTYDCALGGHYGYAYIDGICQSFVSGTADSICAGGTSNFCAPTGLASYTWNGPGVVNAPGQCVNVSAAGIYTCNTTLVTGCTGPQFTYTLSYFPNPIPGFNFSSANACATQLNFFNTSGVMSGSIASQNWTFGGGNNSGLQNPVFNFAGAGTYPVTLSITSDKGCSASIVQNITIYPLPAPSFQVNNACQGSVVNFTNTSAVLAGNIGSFNWQFGNGNSSGQISPSETYNASGTYNVTLTAVSNQNCVASFSSAVTIHPLPQVMFSASNACLGNASNFSNNSNIVSGTISNYSWDFENDNLVNSIAVNPTYVYPAFGNYVVNLTAVSNFNCVSSATSMVQVMNNPSVIFSTSNICFGQPTIFNNQSGMTGGSIVNYGWNMGDGTMLGGNAPQHIYSAPGTYTVQLMAQANNGCTGSANAIVTVHHLPQVNFSSNEACLNQATQFNNSTIINGGTISKWRWDFNNDGIWDDTVSTSPFTIYPAPGTYFCKLQAMSNNNCASEKINHAVVHANPVANFINKPVCLGNVSTFTNTSSSADGAITSYQWDYDGDNVTDNISANPSFTYSANGVYLLKLEVQTIYGCTDVKSKSMYVNPSPVPVFAAPSRSSCPDFCVTFTNSSTIATGSIVNAFWQFGDGSPTVADKGNVTHCYKTGNYDVALMVVSDSGCRATVTRPSYITVYPRPIAGFKTEPDEVDENDPKVEVVSTAEGANHVSYFINDNTTAIKANFSHTFKDLDKISPMIYQLVKNEHGCTDTAYQKIKVKPAFIIYVPNSFTPNNDGINDGWFAKGVGITKYNMQVFDRWGHLLFETSDLDEAWDGRTHGSIEPIKQDVYVWRAVVKDVFNRQHDLAGTVTLLK